jgi:NAD(P)-dependent dehydrogenase (short-subunit alcohol dehydrogenase family)
LVFIRMGQFDNKIVLVTGASRGIGRAAALGFAKEGAHIIALARTVGGLEELDDEIKAAGSSATLVPLDLLDFDAIDRLGAAIYEKWGRLDVLVGNAGLLGGLSPLGHYEVKTYDRVMGVNVTANWRLIRSLDPLLRQSESGRAIFLTSGAAHKGKPFWGLYAATKAALEAMVRAYAAEMASTPVRANLLNPGPMRTHMRAQAMPGEDASALPHPSELVPAFLKMASPDFTANGTIYDFPSQKILPHKMPA